MVTKDKKQLKEKKPNAPKKVPSLEATIYNREGKEVEKISLPGAVFGVKLQRDLLHQVITTLGANTRTPVAHTKDRGDVSGGGKKPWRQKGTGRARHGSIRSPLWRGGGVTFGPRNEKIYKRDLNRKVKSKALAMILSSKFKAGEIVFVDTLNFNKPQTRDAHAFLQSLAKEAGLAKIDYKRGRRALITTIDKDDMVVKSFRNIESSSVEEIRNVNPFLAMNYRYIIILNPKESIAVLSKRLTS